MCTTNYCILVWVGDEKLCGLIEHKWLSLYTVHFAVVLHYIGHGRRSTGDWCFQDGFITFRELANIYLLLLRGRIMTIVTDCSYSGCWVEECMNFLDEQGVGPCGHAAKDKKIFIGVYATCLAQQIPRQLAFSVHGCKNDRSLRQMVFYDFYDKITADFQDTYTRCLNFSGVRCGQKSIGDECLCFPGATWKTWRERQRIQIARDKDRNMWHILRLPDDEEAILHYQKKVALGSSIKYRDHGEVLESGLGEAPPEELFQSVLRKHNSEVYQRKTPL